MNVHRAVLDSGNKQAGIIINYVDGDYDTGPIIAQTVISIEPGIRRNPSGSGCWAREYEFFVETLAELVSGLEDQPQLP